MDADVCVFRTFDSMMTDPKKIYLEKKLISPVEGMCSEDLLRNLLEWIHSALICFLFDGGS